MKFKNVAFIFLSLGLFSCTNDSSDNEEAIDIISPEDPGDSAATCTDVANYVFKEKDGLVKIEFENAVFDSNWKLKEDDNAASGKGYMVWEGDQSLSQPGNGLATYAIAINEAGTYRFVWRSSVKTGTSGSDHNDTWLRFNDVSNFFAQKGESIVYPADSGKTPNPEGASKDGWFKIYRSGSDLNFKWQASTFDNNSHDIFVTFDQAGTYTMEISARSSGHAIDEFVLFNESISLADATADTAVQSAITCNN
ncbi:hypothetical protein Celal_1626 [Cellulophaga algicola DSM 14237]|uniref:Lipoprotein n=1 Tax=Cellulophaga algicola (strain DSM 14237 / IC166 / ACAM 630) TaxID=688270 RepID=E6XBT3_CELAD|nr:hypothetical protein [Cellulophaga algicola]ADV48935.1 hypothetical protein Celal_1626 [Cellulophaga algicola DSM 14237]